jgi:hypothetical protein
MHRVGGAYPMYPPKVERPPWANSYRVLWTGKKRKYGVSGSILERQSKGVGSSPTICSGIEM